MLPLLVAIALCVAAYFYFQSTQAQAAKHRQEAAETTTTTTTATSKESPSSTTTTTTNPSSSPSSSVAAVATSEVNGGKTQCGTISAVAAVFPKRILIAYSTMKGNSRQLSHKLFSTIIGARYPSEAILAPEVHDMKDVDLSKLHVNYDLVVLVLSTYTGGSPPEGYEHVSEELKDMVQDFRVPRDHFAPLTDAAKRRKREKGEDDNNNGSEDDTNVVVPDTTTTSTDGEKYAAMAKNVAARHPPQFAIFGLGDVAYGTDFNRFAKDVDGWLKSVPYATSPNPKMAN